MLRTLALTFTVPLIPQPSRWYFQSHIPLFHSDAANRNGVVQPCLCYLVAACVTQRKMRLETCSFVSVSLSVYSVTMRGCTLIPEF